MKNFFPEQNQNFTYYQLNRGDDTPNIWSSFGLDFQSNLGMMRVAPRLLKNTDSTDDADLGLPVAIRFFGGKLFAICGTRVFVNSDGDQPNASFTEDASTGAQTDYVAAYSDMECFNTRLWASTNDGLYSLDASSGGTWTSRDTLTGSTSHLMTYFQKFDRLYYTNGSNNVLSINTSDVVADPGSDYAIDLGNYQTCIRATTSYIWVGTGTTETLAPTVGSVIYQWDGISAQATNAYKVNAPAVMSLCVMDDIPYALDAYGRLLKYTGTSFEEIGRLPIQNTFLTGVDGLSNVRFVHPNGMIPTKNKTILVLVNNLNNNSGGTINENLPSGIWEWSEQFGFVHKYAFTYTDVGSSTITDFGQNRVSAVGALADVNFPSTNASRNGTIMAGATYYTNASATANGIFIDDSNNTIQKKGYFVTSWFDSKEIEDKWSRIWAVYRRLLASDDSIVLKYRLYEEDPVEGAITWVNTTSFTVLNSAVDVSDYWTSGVGGEVEITRGTGGGSCVHITNAVNNAGTWTVTIDTAVTGVTTGTATARFQKWIRLNPIITGQIKSYDQLAILANNTRIQIKGCMTFTGDDEFQKFVLTSNSDIEAKL